MRTRFSLVLVATLFMFASQAFTQETDKDKAKEEAKAEKEKNKGGVPMTKEVYTGTMVNMNGRTATVGFTLTLTGRTSDDEARRELGILAQGGQDDLLKAIDDYDLGFIAATGQ